MNTLPPLQEMERAYMERDASFDGIFVLAVRTTGIFCRPTCPARKPKPKNVEYFQSPKAALASGYRPCKRCRPMHIDDQPEWVTSLFEAVNQAPDQRMTDADIRRRGVDPGTVRRYFQKRYGMTFHSYARARRLGTALSRIREGDSIDAAADSSGFESNSGFREAFARVFGDPPGRVGQHECLRFDWIRSPLGPLVAGATSDGICLLEFTDRRMLETQLLTVRRKFRLPATPGRNDHIAQLDVELGEYFAGRRRVFDVSLVYPGSEFQERVWEAHLSIPYGATWTYEQLALHVQAPGAQRAVGRTNGLNRISIVIPCHRVIGKNGQLTGYGGGLYRKKFLLDLEQGERSADPLLDASNPRVMSKDTVS